MKKHFTGPAMMKIDKLGSKEKDEIRQSTQTIKFYQSKHQKHLVTLELTRDKLCFNEICVAGQILQRTFKSSFKAVPKRIVATFVKAIEQ